YVDVLFQNAKKIGVDIKLNTKVVELITNTEANEVLGVKAESKGKPLYVRATKGVVIATGGFCGDVNMIDKFILDFRGALTFASANSEGQGLKMAEKIGAASTHMNFAAVYGYGVPMSKDKNNRKGWIFRGHVMNLYGPITVGPDGKRFVNDDLGATSISQAMSHLGFKKVFQVATEAQLLDFMKNDPIQVIGWDQNTFKKELEEQKVFVVKADTIAELAKKMGLPADQLEATVKRYNQFVKNGKDEDFGRKYMKGTFEKGPFYGFIGQPIAGISLGGLKVNKDLQVLDVYDQPIKHLYAAGEAIGGIHGGSYIGGNSVGSSLTLGMVAGKKAAASK
ncbi:FAD-dependent oxidoreductase, partial [Parasutterella excrementihominis]